MKPIQYAVLGALLSCAVFVSTPTTAQTGERPSDDARQQPSVRPFSNELIGCEFVALGSPYPSIMRLRARNTLAHTLPAGTRLHRVLTFDPVMPFAQTYTQEGDYILPAAVAPGRQTDAGYQQSVHNNTVPECEIRATYRPTPQPQRP